ncbi:hypothetical protein [Microbacterium sp.]|uniref:hypothetical protein n=1 Tax=Microbacterium sp. TaxID=51671 RepID=UPI0025D24CB0|nr:hypothetical protein [Microbacterium sp.]MBT9605764.1 hypothetical protein [Microbacterium sp.]
MNTSTTTRAAAPDETEKARQLIELGLALDPAARSVTVARLIAASLHAGPDTALKRFAATGTLDAQAALDELNNLHVPFSQEGWVETLGQYIVATGDRS